VKQCGPEIGGSLTRFSIAYPKPDRNFAAISFRRRSQMARNIGHRTKPIAGKEPCRISRKASPLTREVLAAALDCVIAMDHQGKITEFNAAAEKIFGYSRPEAIGKELAELIIPPSHREAHRRALVHYRAKGEGTLLNKRIELTAKRADNTEFPVELTVTKIGNQWPPHFVGFVRDITERKRTEEEVQRHRRCALILHEINSAVTSSLDLQTVIAFLLQKVDSLLPYAVSTLRLLNKETGILEPTACRNIDETEWKTIEGKPKGGLARIVFDTGAPLVIGDARRDPRTRHPDFLAKHGLFSYLGLPLVSRGKTLGIMSFYTKEVHAFNDEEIEFLPSPGRLPLRFTIPSFTNRQKSKPPLWRDPVNERPPCIRSIWLSHHLWISKLF
jgi:PAS domain S-box-containing protein